MTRVNTVPEVSPTIYSIGTSSIHRVSSNSIGNSVSVHDFTVNFLPISDQKQQAHDPMISSHVRS